jgi:hypothetical protein
VEQQEPQVSEVECQSKPRKGENALVMTSRISQFEQQRDVYRAEDVRREIAGIREDIRASRSTAIQKFSVLSDEEQNE